MRTTLTLDEDVAAAVRRLTRQLGRRFKDVVNEALRHGLPLLQQPPPTKVYSTQARPLGLKPGMSLDNVQELLSQLDGEDER
jgi:hypothetical protein